MIKIIEKEKNKVKTTPYYILEYGYMIGDANGDTSYEVKISKDNPYLERYYKLLNSLEPTDGYWGISFEEHRLKLHFEEGQISEDDYKFLCALMFEQERDFDYSFLNVVNKKHIHEFIDGVQGDVEYSYLSFEYLALKYIDEYGVEYKATVE